MDMDPILGMLTLGAATWLIGLLSVAFLFCSVLLILTVLIQRPQGGGLSGAFGAGAGSGETAFGARTGDALTIATISFFVIWLLVAVGLVMVMQPPSGPTETRAASTEPAPEPTGGDTTPPAGAEQPTTDTGGPGDQPVEQPADQPGDVGGQPADDQTTGQDQTGGGDTDGGEIDGGGTGSDGGTSGGGR